MMTTAYAARKRHGWQAWIVEPYTPVDADSWKNLRTVVAERAAVGLDEVRLVPRLPWPQTWELREALQVATTATFEPDPTHVHGADEGDDASDLMPDFSAAEYLFRGRARPIDNGWQVDIPGIQDIDTIVDDIDDGPDAIAQALAADPNWDTCADRLVVDVRENPPLARTKDKVMALFPGGKRAPWIGARMRAQMDASRAALALHPDHDVKLREAFGPKHNEDSDRPDVHINANTALGKMLNQAADLAGTTVNEWARNTLKAEAERLLGTTHTSEEHDEPEEPELRRTVDWSVYLTLNHAARLQRSGADPDAWTGILLDLPTTDPAENSSDCTDNP